MKFLMNVLSSVTAAPVPATKIFEIYNRFADQHFLLLPCLAAACAAVAYFSITGCAASVRRSRTGRELREGRVTTEVNHTVGLELSRRRAAWMAVLLHELKRLRLHAPRPSSKAR